MHCSAPCPTIPQSTEARRAGASQESSDAEREGNERDDISANVLGEQRKKHKRTRSNRVTNTHVQVSDCVAQCTMTTSGFVLVTDALLPHLLLLLLVVVVVVSSSGHSIVASSATQAAAAAVEKSVVAEQPDVAVGRSLVAAPLLGLLARVPAVPAAAAAAAFAAVTAVQFARAVVASLVLGAPRMERCRCLQHRHSVRVVAQPLRLDGLALAAAVAAPSFWIIQE